MLRTVRAFYRASALLEGLQNGVAVRAAHDNSYVYLPPGCSLHDPQDIPTETVHYVDVPPKGRVSGTSPESLEGKGSKTAGPSRTSKKDVYTYAPPGCSISDPVQHSSDTVHFYDPPPPPSHKPVVQQVPAGGASKHTLGGAVQGQSTAGKGKGSSRPSIRMMDDYSSQTYVYSVPRGSMKEPRYISTSDPTYVPPASTEGQSKSQPGTPPASPECQSKFQPGAPSPRTKAGTKHPYKMNDDYAQQPYVYSVPRGSMKEPKYVSTSDPSYS